MGNLSAGHVGCFMLVNDGQLYGKKGTPTWIDQTFFLAYLRSMMGKAMTDCGGQLMISSKNHEGTVPLSSN